MDEFKDKSIKEIKEINEKLREYKIEAYKFIRNYLDKTEAEDDIAHDIIKPMICKFISNYCAELYKLGDKVNIKSLYTVQVEALNQCIEDLHRSVKLENLMPKEKIN